MRLLFTLLFACTTSVAMWAQCNTNNATDCVCPDGTQDCDLIPNIKVSYDLLVDPNNNPETPGLLRVSVSTPNIGYGPLTVMGSDHFLCDIDTIISPGGLNICPDGVTPPKQLVIQRVYHKSGNTMTYTDRWGGSMTYHPTHSHMHFDDWGIYTLRVIQPNEPNPLNWPIIGQGSKLGFCLMDYGTCSYYNGHCRDGQNNVMLNGDFPNFGLGGGNYNCSPINQGISVGYTDIYYQYLDGMYIDIPAGVCNGNYAVVVHVDPHNVLLETNDADNVMWAPITLTEQSAAPSVFNIVPSASPVICGVANLDLSVPNVGTSYLWSNGETTPTITVNTPGTYTCEITMPCGITTTNPLEVTVTPVDAPTTTADTICVNSNATLTASAQGAADLRWYDAPVGGNLLYTGATFVTPPLAADATYYVERFEMVNGVGGFVGPQDNNYGTGGYHNSPNFFGAIDFTASAAFTLVSAWVDADGAGDRTFILQDDNGNTIDQVTVNIPDGQSRVTLNLNIPAAGDYAVGGYNMALYRNNSGTIFPYSLPGTCTLTGTPAGGQYYYYLYDWEVQQTPQPCISPRAEVTAKVEICAGQELPEGLEAMTIIPNPNDGRFNLNLTFNGQADVQYMVFDANGRRIMARDLGTVAGQFNESIQLDQVAAGVYMVQVLVDGKAAYRKVVVE